MIASRELSQIALGEDRPFPDTPENRQLNEQLLRTITEATPLPDTVLDSPRLRAAARSMEHVMFQRLVEYVAESGADLPSGEVLPLLEGFARLRTQLAEPARPRPVENVALRWETLELAHDFRSPLTSILFLADTLRRGQSGPVSELQHRQLGIIYSAALRLVSFANDVIGLTHGGEQLMDRKPSAFSLRELFESTVEVVQPIADDRKLSLRLLVQGPDRRIGHPAILSRVFLNLTTNALKYTDEGMVEMIARPTTGDRVELSIRDTGRGLDKETIEHLYEPFRSRPEGGRRSLDSCGLGLTICRKLVEAIGSDLQYETSASWGTRFFFDVSLPPAPPTRVAAFPKGPGVSVL